MFRAAGIVGVFVVCVFLLSGCATTSRKNLETQGLRNQISVLESQLQAKDSEIADLRSALMEAQSPKDSAVLKASGETKSRPKVKDIQLALRNAGYNPGPVDGKIGAKTREAIRAFQRENGLSADGKVGKKTWELLRKYLTQKIK